MSAETSGLYSEDGQMWLRVSPGHAISEQWLHDVLPSCPRGGGTRRASADATRSRCRSRSASRSWRRPSRGRSWHCGTRRDAEVDAGRQGGAVRG